MDSMDLSEMSLEDLQRQFFEVQEEEATQRLADRNVIELVFYLQKTGRIKNLIFTLDGKEYLTQKQVRREIEEQIDLSGGTFFLQSIQLSTK